MSQPSDRPTVLCIGNLPKAVSAATSGARVVTVGSAQQALARLATGGISAVLAEPAVLQSILQPPEADNPSLVLDALAEGVCITDPRGHLRWSNAPLREMGTEVAELVMRFVARVADRLADQPDATAAGARHSTREATSDGRHVEITVTPVIGADGALVRTVAVALDRTARVVLQQRISAIEEAGRRLLHLDPDSISRLSPEQRLSMLQRQVISLTRNLLRFDHFRIRLLDPGSGRLALVLDEGHQDVANQRELRAEIDGSGISGYVAATGQAYICNDVRSDPRYLPWLDDARSSLTVPLWHKDTIVGTFNVESATAGAFGQQDLQALEIFSHYVAQALVTLQLLIAEKVSTTDQLAADVSGELDAPLAGILAAVDALRASAVGHDEATLQQFDEITRHVDRIRHAVRQVTDAKRPVTGTAAPNRERRQPLSGRRLLVADDEQVIRDTLSEILAGLGATVDLAADGREAIDLAGDTAYDLVLADIRMPRKTGYEVFSAVRDLYPEMPVILMTAFGYDPSHSIVKARGEGLKAVLFKPFKIQVLYEEISQALGIELPVKA